MSEPAGARQERILLWLRDNRTLGIEELSARLDVSVMTIHRDINELVRIGAAEKIHGGVRLAGHPLKGQPTTRCAVCGGSTSDRAAFIVSRGDAETATMCCPHCGMLAGGLDSADAILARDFLYGRMVNARQAYYLVGSEVTLCCQPGVLCFQNQRDAARFQTGFSGEVMSFEEACAAIANQHASCDGTQN